MRKADIEIGGVYTAKVDGVLCHVKVTSFPKTGTGYNGKIIWSEGADLIGKRTQFGSAARFLKPVDEDHDYGPYNQKVFEEKAKAKKEGEKRPDPIKQVTPTPTAAPVKAVVIGDGGQAIPLSPSGKCLGYIPNLISGLCRCKWCQAQPREKRTIRPAQVEATPVEPNSGEENTPWTGTGQYDDPTPLPQRTVPAGRTVEGRTPEPVGNIMPQRQSVLAGLGSVQLEFDTAPHVIVEARAGCLAADTIIHVNRAGKGSRMRIDKVVAQFRGQGALVRRSDNGAFQRVRPWDMSIPTMVARAVDGVVRLCRLKDAWYSGRRQTYTVTTMTGRSIRATAIHPFLLESGEWKQLGELVVGDRVRVNTGHSCKGPEEKEQYRYTDCNYHPNQTNNGGGRMKVPFHRCVVEADMNRMTLSRFLHVIRHESVTSAQLKYLSQKQIVHHKNEDTFDNAPGNLEVLESVSEHSARHNWTPNVLWQIGAEEIVSIEPYGMENTYDLEVEDDPHNFIANGFVVHNTGKTTTMIEGLRVMLGFGTHITPSPQQQAVWDQLMLSQGKAKSICCIAFNKSIAAELKRRVPPGVEAMTMHGLGFRAVNRAVRLWGGDRSVTEWRTSNIMEELLKSNIQDLRRSKPMMVKAVQELVGLCKVNLIGYRASGPGPAFVPGMIDGEQLDTLVSHFDIDLDGTSRDEVYPLVTRTLERALDVEKDRCIDYDDMIWLPVVLGMPVQRYDILLGDEVQDWNRCQQALAKMAGERLILVGDPKQAIYGFAGADNDSMNRMHQELTGTSRGSVLLPLTVTRRCGKAIVKEANKIVPEFEAHESNGEGKVTYAAMKADESVGKHAAKSKDGALVTSYQSMASDGDMVLCRVNAPLVSECFRFIKAGRKANIQGRDVGKGLVKTVEKMKAHDVAELVMKLEMWCTSEVEKEQKKKYPSEARVIATQDKLDCLMCFIDGVDSKASPSEVTRQIEAVFTDDKNAPGIRLSSIHKSKGLEAQRVFLLEPEGATVPHPMARGKWQLEQEWNLRYVAVTRAISELVFVS